RLPDVPGVHIQPDRPGIHLPHRLRVGLELVQAEVGLSKTTQEGAGTGRLSRPFHMATTSASGTEFSDEFETLAVEGEELPPGIGPWRLAGKRLRRNKVSLFFGGLFLLIVILCLLAPVYSSDIAHAGLAQNFLDHPIKVGGKSEYVVSTTGIPIGPTWHTRFLLGADANGSDVAVRLLYGGRNSLEIGAVATIITMVLALILGIVAAYFRGFIDGFISRMLDVIWAFPAVLLGITLGVALAVGGIVPLKGNTLMVPA